MTDALLRYVGTMPVRLTRIRRVRRRVGWSPQELDAALDQLVSDGVLRLVRYRGAVYVRRRS